ncbi:hypothetical protein F511_33341 [Dorcoceras hygrometricum]|uniref:Transposase (putative) gypsy type domain-containing protein n=1 Tax=Dorcoceras hygrometricum TaxID=472368 RepID=A0A2Z7CK97_9LAMI|nr:hypothetical protein F511_33341 [Dorcoceras hygrometricum]
MCHEPSSGYFTTYLDYFSNGFSLPPNGLLIEIVHILGVSFSQLTPNAIIAFMFFRRRVSQTRIPVTLDLFHALFSARCTGPGSYIYFQPRLDCKFLSRIRSPRGSSKSNFLYVRDRGWGVQITWSSGLSKIKIGGTHYALQLECGSLGLFDETIDPRLLLPPGSFHAKNCLSHRYFSLFPMSMLFADIPCCHI